MLRRILTTRLRLTHPSKACLGRNQSSLALLFFLAVGCAASPVTVIAESGEQSATSPTATGGDASDNSAWPEPAPIFLALDGIEFGPTLDTIVRSGRAGVRTQDYLAAALTRAWGDKLEFHAVPWGGRLHDDGQLANYLSLSRAQLCRLVAESEGRPIVVIGHSWGSVVGYQVIRALETQSCPGGSPLPSDALDLFVKAARQMLKVVGRAGVFQLDDMGNEFV